MLINIPMVKNRPKKVENGMPFLKSSLIWLVAVIFAILSGLAAMGAVAKSKAPQTAVSIIPINGFAAENLALSQIRAMIAKEGGEFPEKIALPIQQLAQRAFVAEPLAANAVTILGLAASSKRKRELMDQALLLSRRQTVLTSWLISDSGKRNEIPAILGYFDTMLRTNSNATGVILPALANALVNETSIEPFAALLETGPPWARMFWGRVIATPAALPNAVKLRTLLDDNKVAKPAFMDAEMISGLVRHGNVDDADALYRLLSREKGDSKFLRNGSFESVSRYPPFDWQLASTGEYGASIADGGLNISAVSGSSGWMARQLVKIPNEALVLSAEYRGSPPQHGDFSISLSCFQTQSLRTNPVRFNLTETVSRFRIRNAPSSCRYYWLSVNGSASDGSDGFDTVFESITLQPI